MIWLRSRLQRCQLPGRPEDLEPPYEPFTRANGLGRAAQSDIHAMTPANARQRRSAGRLRRRAD
jgi:hypothetical protein